MAALEVAKNNQNQVKFQRFVCKCPLDYSIKFI